MGKGGLEHEIPSHGSRPSPMRERAIMRAHATVTLEPSKAKEPGALAVNPLSPAASASNLNSIDSASTTSNMESTHIGSVRSPVARRKTHLLTSVPMDLERNRMASHRSIAEPESSGPPRRTQVGAHAMRNSAPPAVLNKLQGLNGLPAGSHAALSRQAHNANTKQRHSSSTRVLPVTSHHSISSLSSRRLGFSRNPIDLVQAKKGNKSGHSSRHSIGIGRVVDVDELEESRNSMAMRPTRTDSGISTKSCATFGSEGSTSSSRRVAVNLESDIPVPPSTRIGEAPNISMISACLVIENGDDSDDEQTAGMRMTKEERNALYEQAQRDAEAALHEKMMSNMVMAEAVVDEQDIMRCHRRRRCIAGGLALLVIIIVGGMLGVVPWAKNDEERAGEQNIDLVDLLPPPNNDVCDDAITMEWGTEAQWQQGSTVGASDSKLPSCSSQDEFMWGRSSVWYRIVGTGFPLRVSSNATMATDNSKRTVTWNTELSVYSGHCGSLTCVGTHSNNDEQTSTPAASVTWFSEVGDQYFICVHSERSKTETNEDDPYGSVLADGMVEDEIANATTITSMTAGDFSLTVDQGRVTWK